MRKKAKIAILGDFPIGMLLSQYKGKKCFYAAWLYTLHNILKKTDQYDIHWLVFNKEIKARDIVSIDNQTFHLFPEGKATLGIITAYVKYRFIISKYLKKLNPDLLHVWGTERFYGLAAKDFKGKTLLSVQGILTAYSKRAKLSWFERLQSIYEPCVCKKVNYISTESVWAKDRILEIAPLANVTLWEYAPQDVFFSIKRNLTDTPTCLLAGTNTPVKDINTAIKAFSSPKLSHVKLYLAGVKKDQGLDLPPNVIPLGLLSRDEIAVKIGETWCLIHPSLADSSPNIVKEARVAGVPAIVTEDCGGKQYIENGKSGFIIQPKDVNALIASVVQITQSKEISIKMGAYDHERCIEALSKKTMESGIMKLYNKILNN